MLSSTSLRILLSCCSLLLLGIFLVAQNAPQEKPADPPKRKIPPLTTVEWLEETYDFGTAKTGEEITHTFHFCNAGTNDLYILNARASCGCTTPSYDGTTPVAPGDTASVDIVFDTHDKYGPQKKVVVVTVNTQKRIKGLEVIGTLEKE